MSHKYDIESDQVKCNFCTQWFKCTLHYANIQRYSLKACHKCLKNFTFTILHPDTYHIYKVLLLDSNITIPLPQASTSTMPQELTFQLELAEQEIKDKICQSFEEKIRTMLEEMKKGTNRVQQVIQTIKSNLFDKNSQQLQQLITSRDQLLKKLNDIREAPLQQWANDQSKLTKNTSTMLASSRNSSSHQSDKQNFNHNRQGCCKAIKNKATGILDSKAKMTVSYIPQPPKTQRPRSFSRLNNSKSNKSLAVSFYSPSSDLKYDQRDLAQIIKLLQSYHQGYTYLPHEVQPQHASLIKTQSKRTQADSIIDLRARTSRGNQLIELIGAQASKVNFQVYLKSLGPQPLAKIVRVIKAGITDYEFDSLLRFLSSNQGIETLIVTNNRLTELSVSTIQNFINLHPETNLKRIYLGSNRIIRERAAATCKTLSESGIQLHL